VDILKTQAWYHVAIAVDTTKADTAGTYTDIDRVRVYVNGVLQDSIYQNYDPIPQNFDFFINNDYQHNIGKYTGNTKYLDGYLADVNFVDGTQIGDTNGILDEFIEIKNGVCIPKAYSGAYGNNGFRLEFKETGDGSSTASSSTIGADTKNSNHFLNVNMSSHDSNMPDSPENNFSTLNPIHGASSSYDNQFELKEGNLHLYNASAANQGTCSTILMENGKWYWEIFIKDTNSTYNHHIGVVNGASFIEPASAPKAIFRNDGIVYYTNTSGNAAEDTSPSGMTAGEVWACAFDADNNTIKFYVGGSQTGNTISLDDPNGAGWKTYAATGQASADNSYWNFGQDSSFAGEKTSGSAAASDGEGIGDFYYTPPSGYLALCTANLPEPTIGPNANTQADNHFDVVLRTGTGSEATQALGFKPDFLWTKTRSHTVNHNIASSSLTYNYSFLQSNTTAAENTGASTYYMTPTSTGYTIGTGDNINQNNYTFVDWLWKANGGTTSTIGVGSVSSGVPSIASTVQANTTAGFSIVTFEGNKTRGATIGHGLGVKPDMIIMKNRDLAVSWVVWFPNLQANNQLLELNSTGGVLTNTGDVNAWWNNTAPDQNVITLGDYDGINDDLSMLAFCFADIEGYSKFGSYVGNGDDDGAFVYLGFRPAWVMVKRTDSANNWVINDTTRSPFNEITGNSSTLYAGTTNKESDLSTNVDFLSNGFKARTTAGHRNAGGTYVYMAFAEAPFKYANAR